VFYIDSGIFHKVLIYLVFNSGWQKNLMPLFLTFQELRDSKNGKVGEYGSQISRRIQRAEEGHQEVKEVEMGAHHSGWNPSGMVPPLLGLRPLFASNFAPPPWV
jgi:hypothetical protein